MLDDRQMHPTYRYGSGGYQLDAALLRRRAGDDRLDCTAAKG